MKPPFSWYVAVTGMLLVCGDAHALGRLFTDVAERQQLDHPDAQSAQSASEPTHNAEPVLLNGFVKSRQGRKTLWINGNMHDDIKSLELSAGRVIVDAQGRRMALKPGQRLDLNQHEIREVYDLPADAEAAPTANQPSLPAHSQPKTTP